MHNEIQTAEVRFNRANLISVMEDVVKENKPFYIYSTENCILSHYFKANSKTGERSFKIDYISELFGLPSNVLIPLFGYDQHEWEIWKNNTRNAKYALSLLKGTFAEYPLPGETKTMTDAEILRRAANIIDQHRLPASGVTNLRAMADELEKPVPTFEEVVRALDKHMVKVAAPYGPDEAIINCASRNLWKMARAAIAHAEKEKSNAA